MLDLIKKVFSEVTRLYSLLDYTKFTLLVFSEDKIDLDVPQNVNVIQLLQASYPVEYKDMIILVRPDSYIESTSKIDNYSLKDFFNSSNINLPSWERMISG